MFPWIAIPVNKNGVMAIATPKNLTICIVSVISGSLFKVSNCAYSYKLHCVMETWIGETRDSTVCNRTNWTEHFIWSALRESS